MAITNNTYLYFGAIPFEISTSRGWVVNSVSQSLSVEKRFVSTDIKYNILGKFTVTTDLNTNLVLTYSLKNDENTNDIKVLRDIATLISTVDTVASMPTSYSSDAIQQAVILAKNIAILPTILVSFYSNSKKHNSFFLQVLNSINIEPLSSDSNEVFIVSINTTSKYFDNQEEQENNFTKFTPEI